MQPSWGSQRRPPAVSEQLLVFGVWRQEPFSQVSSVHATPSLQSVFWQHVRQPTPGQQRKLPPQPLELHVPLSQRAVWHSTTGQSESIEHSAVWTQPRVGSQVLLRGQLVEFGVFEHEPAAHLSSVQATLSLHSAALQQVPHVAEPLALVQHRFPGQRSTCLHCPDSQTPL